MGFQSQFQTSLPDDWRQKVIELLQSYGTGFFTYRNAIVQLDQMALIQIKYAATLGEVGVDPYTQPYSLSIDLAPLSSMNSSLQTQDVQSKEFGLQSIRVGSLELPEGRVVKLFSANHTIDRLPVAALRRAGFVESFELLDTGSFLTDDEWHQIYDDISSSLPKKENHNSSGNSRIDLSDYKALQKILKAKAANVFYASVNLCIEHSYSHRGQVRISDSYQSNPGAKCEVTIRIDQSAKGVRTQVDLADSLFKKDVSSWAAKAKKRGMDIDVEKMRTDLIGDLEEMMNETSWYTKTEMDIVAWYEDNIGGFVEVVQATTKVGENIWEVGTINESIWHTKDSTMAAENKLWPETLRFHPLTGGVVDGVVDEIVGIPLACKSVYQVCTDKEKRDAFKGMLSEEGLDMMLEGIGKELESIKNDGQKQGYVGAKTTVSVASSFFGVGLFNKAGKAIDLVTDIGDAATDVAKFMPDAKTARYLEQLRKTDPHVEVDDAIQHYRKLNREALEDLGEFDKAEIGSIADQMMGDAFHEFLEGNPGLTTKQLEKFWKKGREFDDLVKKSGLFDYNQIGVLAPKNVKYPKGHASAGKRVRYVLDAYTPGKSIVSSKISDLGKIKFETFQSYVYELRRKYPPGAVIKSKSGAEGVLKGKLKLQFPKPDKMPADFQKYIDFAAKTKINDLKVEIIFFPP